MPETFVPLAQPITFKQKLKSQVVEEGNSVTLHCEVSNDGLPVEWRKGQELLKSGEKYRMRQRSCALELTIFSLICEDSDVYSCSCGDVQTSARVTVSSKCHKIPPVVLLDLWFVRGMSGVNAFVIVVNCFL